MATIRQLSSDAYQSFLGAFRNNPLTQYETIETLQAQLDDFANLNTEDPTEAQQLQARRTQWLNTIQRARTAQKFLVSIEKAGTAYRATFDTKYIPSIPISRIREEALLAKANDEGTVSLIISPSERSKLMGRPYLTYATLLMALILLTGIALHFYL